MKNDFHNTSLAFSVYSSKEFPKKNLLEVPIVGRSNVGKSSLINHLTQKKIAKTSSTPGKTRAIHFFCVDSRFYLVDLPGYGFAKASKDDQEFWKATIEHYFSQRPSLKLILFLLDIRRLPTKEDISFLHYAKAENILLVLTKTDTIKLSEIDNQKNLILEALKEHLQSITSVYFSVKDTKSRTVLIDQIQKLLESSC